MLEVTEIGSGIWLIILINDWHRIRDEAHLLTVLVLHHSDMFDFSVVGSYYQLVFDKTLKEKKHCTKSVSNIEVSPK